MSSIRVRARKDGSSTTQVLFRLADGTQSAESFDDHDTALKWQALLDKVGAEKARHILNASVPHEEMMTVGELCEIHIEQLTGIEEGTLRNYRRFVRNDIAPSIGALPLAAFDQLAVAGWVNWLAKKGNAEKTVKNKHGFLSAAMSTGVRLKNVPLDANPCEGRSIGESRQSDRNEASFLTPAEFVLLLKYIPQFWLDLVQFLAKTGVRWGEATALQAKDFDPETRSVRIRRAWKYTAGAGHRIGGPKTRRSRRTISLDEETWSLITHRLAEHPNHFVFTNMRGGPVRSTTFRENVWLPAIWYANGCRSTPDSEREAPTVLPKSGVWSDIKPAQAGKTLGKWPRVHDLRHSCASWMIESGQDLLAVSRHLGHESIKTTCDMYGHVGRDRAASSVAGVTRLLREAGTTGSAEEAA